MSINLANLRAYGDAAQRVMTAAIGVAAPTAATGAYGTGWYDLGALSDAGVTEAVNQTETKKYIWQGGQLGRILRSQFEHPFTIEAAEENAVSLGLARPGVTVVTTGGSAEVQTVTITGVPTGGTFPLTVPGLGTYTAAYNVPTATLATALSSIVGGTVTVSGTAGTSYVVTFPVASGNLAQMQTNSTSLTGGTTPTASVATTTPGVNGTNRSVVAPYSGVNYRQFGFDFIDGTVHLRYILTNAEAVLSGNIVRKSDDLSIIPLTINPYFDAAIGGFFIDMNDDPSRGSTLYV